MGSGNGKRRAESFGEVINDGTVVTGQRRNRILFTKVDTVTGLTVVDMSKTVLINGVATGTTLDDAINLIATALADRELAQTFLGHADALEQDVLGLVAEQAIDRCWQRSKKPAQ
mgnify:CR=1 FL=1